MLKVVVFKDDFFYVFVMMEICILVLILGK